MMATGGRGADIEICDFAFGGSPKLVATICIYSKLGSYDLTRRTPTALFGLVRMRGMSTVHTIMHKVAVDPLTVSCSAFFLFWPVRHKRHVKEEGYVVGRRYVISFSILGTLKKGKLKKK